MASLNEYPGYVKLPKKKPSKDSVKLDFSGHIEPHPGHAKLEGFSLRMLVHSGNPEHDQLEMSISLTPEQWLDLIDTMKAEFESVQKARKEFDEMR